MTILGKRSEYFLPKNGPADAGVECAARAVMSGHETRADVVSPKIVCINQPIDSLLRPAEYESAPV